MTITKVLEPAVGDYVCVYLKHGWVQLKVESEGIVIDVFDQNDDLLTTACILNEDLQTEDEET